MRNFIPTNFVTFIDHKLLLMSILGIYVGVNILFGCKNKAHDNFIEDKPDIYLNRADILQKGEEFELQKAIKVYLPSYSMPNKAGFAQSLLLDADTIFSRKMKNNEIYENDNLVNNHPYRSEIYINKPKGNLLFTYQQLDESPIVFAVFEPKNTPYRVYDKRGLAQDILYFKELKNNDIARYTINFVNDIYDTLPNTKSRFVGFNPIFKGKIDVDKKYLFDLNGWKDTYHNGWALPFNYVVKGKIWQEKDPNQFCEFELKVGNETQHSKIRFIRGNVRLSKIHISGSEPINEDLQVGPGYIYMRWKGYKVANNSGIIRDSSIVLN